MLEETNAARANARQTNGICGFLTTAIRAGSQIKYKYYHCLKEGSLNYGIQDLTNLLTAGW